MIARSAPSTSDTAAPNDAPGGSPWHTVGPDAIALRLETSPHGLSQDEARRRLERDGPNQLAETPPTSAFVILLHQFSSPLICILLAATLVTLLLEEFIDAGVIAAVLALNAIIGFTQERKAEQSVRALPLPRAFAGRATDARHAHAPGTRLGTGANPRGIQG